MKNKVIKIWGGGGGGGGATEHFFCKEINLD